MQLRFDSPEWLILLLLLIPVALMTRRSVGGITRAKAVTIFVLRTIVILLLTAALSRPFLVRQGAGLTVTVVLDRSLSVPVALRRASVDFLQRATTERPRQEDRLALVLVGREAEIVALPDVFSTVQITADPADLAATNLAEGIALAMAIMPNDTANRILLVSDGNETIGSALAAADSAAAAGVPIDILPLEYDYPGEVLFEQMTAPTQARVGQTIRLRMVLRSVAEASGIITLRMDDQQVPIGEAADGGLRVSLRPGLNVFERELTLVRPGAHRFDAAFLPDDSEMDAIAQNNFGQAVTFVGGEGRVLLFDDGIFHSRFLVEAIADSGIDVDVLAPEQWEGGLVALSAYDAVILCNVPRYAFTAAQDRALHAYVHDIGGGLIMIGGDLSFGAGGWIDSQTARTLPVELNPPQTRQLPSGALALVMHSCEMPQGNYWGQQVAQAAIEALNRLDYVGIVEYNWGMMGRGGLDGTSWAFPMQRVGDKQAALRATQTMVVGDMPSFQPSMQLALSGLLGVPAAQRHVIIISDGDPSPPSEALMQDYIRNRITVTTVMVGGHGTQMDRNRMRMIAEATGGSFYDVTDPNDLPQIFIKEAQFVSRSLIQDGQVFSPAVVSTLPGPASGFSAVPEIMGYVLTAQREGLARTPMVISTAEAQDPLYAHWNYGIGRSIAFTSDLTNRWGARWVEWGRFRPFWEQSVRWVMRSSAPSNVTITTRMDGEEAIVEVEAIGGDRSPINFMRTNAVVVSPEARTSPLVLQQTGPGRYVGRFRAAEAGAWLINVVHETGAGGEGQVGSVRAAVSIPYSREFRAIEPNLALLREIAERTGGRVLSADDPRRAEIYPESISDLPRIPRAIWDVLAILAATMLLLDVAARRIAVEPGTIARLTGGMIGRRPATDGASVEAWRRARAHSAGRVRRDRSGPIPEKAPKEIRFEASEEDRAKAATLRDEEDAPRARTPSAAKPEAGTPGGADEANTTARLLRARRRAQGGENEGGPDS